MLLDLKKMKYNRIFWLFLSLTCAGFIGVAYYFQHVVGLQPCFLCIIQRIAIMAIGIGSFVVFLNPQNLFIKIIGNLVYFIGTIGGLGAAVRQTYMQHNPEPVASCGPGFEYILETSPITEALPKLFLATGNCSEVSWTFLSLSMAEWMIPVFLGYLIINIYINTRKAV